MKNSCGTGSRELEEGSRVLSSEAGNNLQEAAREEEVKTGGKTGGRESDGELGGKTGFAQGQTQGH